MYLFQCRTYIVLLNNLLVVAVIFVSKKRNCVRVFYAKKRNNYVRYR